MLPTVGGDSHPECSHPVLLMLTGQSNGSNLAEKSGSSEKLVPTTAGDELFLAGRIRPKATAVTRSATKLADESTRRISLLFSTGKGRAFLHWRV
jgi:hypothetical protein